MPPKRRPRPPPETRQLAMDALDAKLHRASLQAQRTQGRAKTRPLKRGEFSHALQDLLCIIMGVTPMLPQESGGGFDAVSGVQHLFSNHIRASYMGAADAALQAKRRLSCASSHAFSTN